MDKGKFYNAIRGNYALTEKNVEGFEFLIDYARSHNVEAKDLGYILATAWWETARTMQPVREAYWLSEDWRKKNLRYYPWYGRGYVQLTWDYNYKKAQEKLNLGTQLTSNPDNAMKPDIAVRVLFMGMDEGWFTGKKNRDYITVAKTTDTVTRKEYQNARRIINGTDKAADIAGVGLAFYKALLEASYDFEVVTPPVVVEPPVQPPVVEPEPIKPVEPGEKELVIRKADLSKVTLEDLYQAIKALKGE